MKLLDETLTSKAVLLAWPDVSISKDDIVQAYINITQQKCLNSLEIKYFYYNERKKNPKERRELL